MQRTPNDIYDSEINPSLKEAMRACGKYGFEMFCIIGFGEQSTLSAYIGDERFIAPPANGSHLPFWSQKHPSFPSSQGGSDIVSAVESADHREKP